MKVSNNCVNLIKKFEGLRLESYKASSSERYYTIGYGHYGSDVKSGMVISEKEAEELLINDIAKFESYVNDLMDVYDFSQNQFDALVSFTYNCGKINLLRLTDNKKRTIEQISNALLLYNKCCGKTLKGLQKRRLEEQKLFNLVN